MPKRIRSYTTETENAVSSPSVPVKDEKPSELSVQPESTIPTESEKNDAPVFPDAASDTYIPKPATSPAVVPNPVDQETVPDSSQRHLQTDSGQEQMDAESDQPPVEYTSRRYYDIQNTVSRSSGSGQHYKYYNATVDSPKEPTGAIQKTLAGIRDRISDRVDSLFTQKPNSTDQTEPAESVRTRQRNRQAESSDFANSHERNPQGEQSGSGHTRQRNQQTEQPVSDHIRQRDQAAEDSDPIPFVRRSEQKHVTGTIRRRPVETLPFSGPHRRHEPEEAHDQGGFLNKVLSQDMIRRIIMIGLASIAVFSLIMIIHIIGRSIRTSRLNNELQELHSQSSSGVDTESLVIYSLPEPEVSEENEPSEEPEDVPPEEDDAEETPTPAPNATPTPAPVVKSTVYHQIGGEALPEMATLYEQNKDLVGWINIPGILDLPVVYKNNVFYLTHDFYKKNNTSGTLFLDENHPFRAKTQNLLFHGHNMRDGSMFGRLIQYKNNLPFLKNNCFIKYSSLWQHEEYVIFAVLQVSLDPRDPHFFNYFTHPSFRSDEEFASFIAELMSKSMYAIPVDVKPSDPLITLSTCLDNDRLIIVARRCREGETHQRLRELVLSAIKQ